MLGQIAWDELDLVAVTAEEGVPVSELASLLERLPASLAGRIALASPLAEGTRLPDAPVAAPESAHAELCPEGLAELEEEAALGDLAPEVILRGLGPLRQGAELCVGASTGAGAAGGRLALAVRIEPDGRVRSACVMEDSTGDAALRACIVGAARELAFEPPGGYLDFALPLVLEPGRAHRQAPICR
jgi:hypothetical protein